MGGQVADIRTQCVGQRYCAFPSFGLGAGAAINLNPHFAIDTNLNVTTGFGGESFLTGGRATEFLAGPRAELRARRYGFFLEGKPGLLYWDHVVKQISPTPPYTATFAGHNLFVSDVSAGVEYSPSARVHVRVEVSDLLIRYASSSWSNDLQTSAGVYAGLGKPIAWKPPFYDAKTTHRFYGTSNVLLVYVSTLGMAADAITTQRFISRGFVEGDPFARPLVKYGWSGQIAISVLETSGEVLGMYGLHRIGQHWLERLLPVGIAAAHGIFAYNNTKFSYSKPTQAATQ
jgi:hypothetical protein